MEPNYLYLISSNTCKLLWRNRGFQLSFLIILGLIVFFQGIRQGELEKDLSPNIFSLASFIPYMNSYLFSLLQIIPLIFLGIAFGDKRKLDTLDAVYYRPESNVEYIWGMGLGFAKAFMFMGCISLAFALILHLFYSGTPFSAGIYLFYLFTLVFPTFVFTYGLCVAVGSFIKSHIVCVVLLLSYFIVTIFVVGDWYGGMLDPTGTTLPNAFSEVLGHPDLGLYLMQRLAWLLIGVGCVQLSVIGCKRIPNVSGIGKRNIFLLLVFLGSGVGLIGAHGMREQKKHSLRREYMDTYGKYAHPHGVTISRQEIDFEQAGAKIKVNSSLVVRNEGKGTIPEIVFYLNPGLEVTSIQSEGRELEFTREHQAVAVRSSVASRDSLELSIAYEGRIDENICYQEIPDKVFFDSGANKHFTCRLGKRYAFLEETFVLLTPEALWYPVTEPPLNVRLPFTGNKNFTWYTLRVIVPPGKTIISQGRKEVQGDRMTFTSEYPLTGISICIGDYETRTVVIDSVTCELNVFKRNNSFWKVIDACDNADLKTLKNEMEEKVGRKYPYARFCLTETPVPFFSYFREERMGSEFVQPELMFLPERFTGKVHSPFKFNGTEYVRANMDLSEELYDLLLSHYASNGSAPRIGFEIYAGNTVKNLNRLGKCISNHYYFFPLFGEHGAFLQSEDYPVMNTVCNLILNDVYYDQYQRVVDVKKTTTSALDYLGGHSLQDALTDKKLSREILHEILVLKSHELVNYFNSQGIDRDTLKEFITGYLFAHPFRKVDFSQFDAEFSRKFGHDWMSVLPLWAANRKIPRFLIKDFRVKRSVPSGVYASAISLVEFSVFNDGEVDGIVNLESSNVSFQAMIGFSLGDLNDQPIRMSYMIKAKSGIKVSLYISKSQYFFKLNTNISSNTPRQIQAWEESVASIDEHEEYVREITREEFETEDGTIVVDNEDEEFRVVQPTRFFDLKRYFTGKVDLQEKYENLHTCVFLSNQWKTMVENNAYGSIKRSVVVRNGGDGDSALEWHAELDKEGRYEIFVYVPRFTFMNVLSYEMEKIRVGVQSYTVTLPNGEVKKVEVDVSDTDRWIPLGKFDCARGTCSVTLSDAKTLDPQLMIGDAVKWVYREK